MLQLALELTIGADPLACQHAEPRPEIDKTICRKDGREVWTECHKGHWGEPPTCAWEEPDNSPEAVARRLEWMKNNEEKETEE